MVTKTPLRSPATPTRTTIVARKETARRLGMFKLQQNERSMDDAIMRLLDFWDAAQTDVSA